MNSDIVNACEELRGYVYFVSRVRHYIDEEKADTTTAVRAAIQDCIKGDMLVDFFKNLKMEDEIMLAAEWDLETALKVRGEEMFEEGYKTAEEKILELVEKGYSAEKIRETLSSKAKLC